MNELKETVYKDETDMDDAMIVELAMKQEHNKEAMDDTMLDIRKQERNSDDTDMEPIKDNTREVKDDQRVIKGIEQSSKKVIMGIDRTINRDMDTTTDITASEITE